MVNQKDKEYLLSLKPEDITMELLVDLVASKVKVVNNKFVKVHARFKQNDTFVLNPGEYFNKTKVTTNVGLFLYNKLIIERDLIDVVGYHNETITNTVLGNIEKKLSKALLNDKITTATMERYLVRTQWLGMQFHSAISGSFTSGVFKPNKETIALRDKLVKENIDKVKSGDVAFAVRLEKTLLDNTKTKLDKDSGMNLYKSGSRGSFGNNYKNMSLIKGPTFNPVEGKFETITSNLLEGISKKDMAVYANGIVSGAYPKAVGTQVSGHFAKQILAALQSVKLSAKKDCGSKGYLVVKLTQDNSKLYMYRYIIEGTKLTLLDDDNMSKYIGKTVKMRSPMYCISDDRCVHCCGEIFNKFNITNIGLTSSRVASTLLQLSMKKFHDSTSKITEIDINKLVL